MTRPARGRRSTQHGTAQCTWDGGRGSHPRTTAKPHRAVMRAAKTGEGGAPAVVCSMHRRPCHPHTPGSVLAAAGQKARTPGAAQQRALGRRRLRAQCAVSSGGSTHQPVSPLLPPPVTPLTDSLSSCRELPGNPVPAPAPTHAPTCLCKQTVDQVRGQLGQG